MAEPRKAQINNPLTKYTPLNLPFDLGGSEVQVVSGGNWTALVNGSISKVVGGSETSSPAILYGSMGPFTVSAGNKFSISLPGISGGTPTTITIQAGDLVTLGGVPVLTTQRAITRINTALSAVGVSYPVAYEVGGVLRLRSANGSGLTTGSTAQITITDITPGILVALGFGIGTTYTANGHTAPKKGIIQYAVNDDGGYMVLRGLAGEPATSVSPSLVALGPAGVKNYPSVPIGDPISAKLKPQSSNGSIEYYRTGIIEPHITTVQSNVTTLTAPETVTITITDPDASISWSVPVTFSPVPTVVQDVVDLINAAWESVSSALNAWVITEVSPPYSFQDLTNNLIFKLNGNAAITVNLTNIKSASGLVSQINAAIVAAGQAAEGNAVLVGPFSVCISTLTGNGPGSSIEILNTSSPNTLRMLGMRVGLYVGSHLAKLYGQDEITIGVPMFGPNSSMNIAGLITTMAKLGIVGASVTVNTTTGSVPYSPPLGSLKAAVAEVLDFGDVEIQQDTVTEHFDELKIANPIDPHAGAKNSGLPALLGILGSIDEDLLPRVIHFLGLDTLQLGAKYLSTANPNRARLSIPSYSPVAGTILMAELTDVAGVKLPVRVYQYPGTNAPITVVSTNASFDGTTWTQDDAGVASGAMFIDSDVLSLKHKPLGSAPWLNSSGWETPIILNAKKDGSPVLEIGKDMISTVLNLLTARARTWGSIANQWHLVWESHNGTAGDSKQRIYARPGLTTPGMAISHNAYLDSSYQWNKDTAGAEASLVAIIDGETTIFKEFAATAGAWTSWDWTSLRVSDSIEAGGTVKLGRAMTTSSLINRATPRISGTHTPSGALSRTLMAQFTIEGVSGNINYYVYRGQGFKTTGGGAAVYPADTFLISCNAFWNETLGEWNKENAGDNSSLVTLQGSTFNWFFRGGNVPFTWPDNDWNLAFQATRNGIITPYTEDLTNTGAIQYLTGPASTVKAWGTAVFSRSGGGVLTTSAGDIWNVSNFTLDAGGLLMQINFNSPILHNGSWAGAPNYTVLATAQGFLTAQIPTSDRAVGVPVSTTQAAVSVYAEDSTTPYDLNVNGTAAAFSFVAFGR